MAKYNETHHPATLINKKITSERNLNHVVMRITFAFKL